MRKFIVILPLLIAAAGCASTTTGAGSAQTGQTAHAANSNVKSGFTQAKVKQWFVTDNPYTLPANKLQRMETTGGGFGGY